MSQQWLAHLNPEQIQAVNHNEGPLLILAGAGSGKTTVLVSRAGRLLEERRVEPSKLCVLTFTNRAARELKGRVAARLGDSAKSIWAGTFHSFGLQILRKFHKVAKLPKEFGVLDSQDAGAIAKELLRDFNNAGKTAYDADRLLSILGEWRENKIQNASKEEEYEEAVEWLLPKYLRRMESLGMVDFDGLLLKPLQLMEESSEIREQIQGAYAQIMVDEFQDTNTTQMRLIRKLVEPHRNLTVVGDDDQSIYGWRGACIQNILDFPKLYTGCRVVKLETNYRSSHAILSIANAVISKNGQRHPKQLRSYKPNEPGQHPAELFVYETEDEEIENVCSEVEQYLQQAVPANEIAILYRANGQGAMLEAELRKQKIAYSMSGGTAFFDRKEIKDILSYLRCAIRPNEIGLRRILNCPPRGIGERTIETLTTFSEEQGISFVQAAQRWNEAALDPKTGQSLNQFFEAIRNLVPQLLQGEGLSPGQRLLLFLQQIQFRQHIDKMSANALMASKRWKLVEIFVGILDRFMERGGNGIQSLREFIDAMELRDVPEEPEQSKNKIQLLTFHACKGLEFDVVFLIGLEEDLIPHKTLGTDVSEERRLFYVGITRARKRLILTRAKKRRKHGKWSDSAPSRFLLEIPKELFQEFQSSRPIQEEKRKSLLADLYRKLDALSPSSS